MNRIGIKKIPTNADAQKILKDLGVHGGGVKIMKEKMQLHLFTLYNMHVGAANILKQDALSIGAELALPSGAITADKSHYDALLIANTKQLKQLIEKEKKQYYGLKELSYDLEKFVALKKPQKVEIMGVINANADSFFQGSRFVGKAAYEKIVQMIEDGADIIDIGGVSSRPGSVGITADEELLRLKDIIDMIVSEKLYEKAQFSIDSYAPKVIAYALENGFSIVNDITGLADDNVCKIVAEHKAKAIIMHMQGTPQTMQENPSYTNVVLEVAAFFQERIAKAEKFGIEDIVLDVGIGFGKTLEHNLALIRNLEHFLYLQKPLLMAASRKSLIDKISPSSVDERLGGTLALHMQSVQNGAAMLRVHDVKEHKQILEVLEALSKNK